VVEEGCRIDVWLWRARFFKTRALATKVVAAGAVRLTRAGRSERVSKPGKALRLGDELIFAFAGHLRAVRVEALGERRGPPCEARALYSALENS
jgi:ribosomal 50S subunit-recycling heat shock protein